MPQRMQTGCITRPFISSEFTMNHKTARYAGIKTTLSTALLAALTCTSAFAFGNASAGSNAKNFDGFTLGADLDSEVLSARASSDTATTYTNSYGSYTHNSTTSGSGAAGFLNLGGTGIYRVAIDDNWLIGVGAKMQFTDSKFQSAPDNQRLTGTQTWFITPGYALSTNTMISGKLGLATRAHAGRHPRRRG